MNMKTIISEDRIAFILREIEDHGSVSVVDLAQRLHVSDMTIRRDLADLEETGQVRRVHGGAVSARGRSFEPSIVLRQAESREAKAAIGKTAAELVADGDSIILDVGTTTMELAGFLVGRHNLTVITPSLSIASLLVSQPDIRVILPGGIVRHGELSMTGDLTRKAFEGLFVDRLFLGVGAIDTRAGLTEYNWDDALVKQAMIESAKEVIVLADASKFGKVAFARVAPIQSIHQLVTDQTPPAAFQRVLDKAGVVVHIPDTPGPESQPVDQEADQDE